MQEKDIKFGTSGWRAIIGEQFSFSNARLVTQAIAEYILSENSVNKKSKQPSAIVGYDSRFLGERFALESAKILLSNNIKPLLTKTDTPTPVIAYEIIRRKAGCGINYTASHNPSEYNGIKFSPAYGGPAFSEITNKIEKKIRRLREKGDLASELPPKIDIEYIDPREAYFKRLKELVDLGVLKKLKIIVDPLYGTARHYFPSLMDGCKCRYKIINGWRDVLFGGKPPEPSKENIEELIKEVRREKANIGIATDGDADRFGIIDSDGTYYNPNAVVTLLFYYLHKTRRWNDAVVRTVATTYMIDALAKKYDIEVIEKPVGFKYIAEVMQKRDITIGGEESGGLTIRGHIPEKDGILACLLMAEMVATEKKTIKEIMHNLYKEFGIFLSNRINLRLNEDMDKNLRKNLNIDRKEIAGLKIVKKITIDGTKFLFQDNSWLLFRFSGTEPVVRVYAEADSLKKINVLIEAGKKLASK